MFLMEDKLKARIDELAAFRYRDTISLDQWECREDEGKLAAYPPEPSEETTRILKIGDRWQGRDVYIWLSAMVMVPKEWSDRKIVGRFDYGDTGGGNNSGFESLLFLNSKPYQGVDSNHKEVFFDNSLAGSELAFDFRLWSGMEGGGQPREQEYKLRHASISWLDIRVDSYYFDAKAVLETVKVMDESQPVRQQLLKALNSSMKLIDWLYPGSEAFYNSVYQAEEHLKKMLDGMDYPNPVTFHSIGHTHIDVAWLWRLKHTREKSARSFSTVLRLMEQYPEYTFLQTQPQLYEYIKKDYPEIYRAMKERIGEGRWEVDGGMWLEADCNIPSGESLVRQLLVGTNFIRNEFAKETEYLWLPDVFGYSWALPQILKKSGINTFMTTKISWSQFNSMPHDTFKWRGIDGSEILTHFITTTEPWPESRYYTYNGYMTPQVIKESWDAYKDKNLNQDLLISYGYGDGGGGVNREMLEMRRRIDEMPGMPQVKPSTARDYFRLLHDVIDKTEEYVHTWDGELYLEFHRGTYTSQAFMKQMNRRLELLYRDVEWISSVSSILSGNMFSYPQQELADGWKIILRNQFHDIIPGSSIKEVYEDARLEYEEAEAIGRKAWRTAASTLVSEDDDCWTVFNSAPWPSTELLLIPSEEITGSIQWKDMEGNQLRTQSSEQGTYILVEDIPSMGWKQIKAVKESENQEYSKPFQFGDRSVSTPFYHIEWNEKGQLTSILDLECEREVIAENQKANVLQVFEDKPLMFDAWDIDIYYQEKMEEVTSIEEVKVMEGGQLHTTIRFCWKYGKSRIHQDMVLYADSKRIDFRTEVDWQERQRLLKVAFPVDIRSTEAVYDIQFGNVKRPTHWNTSWDYARFESVGHQWADLSDGGYGVSLLNDCKYGYDIKDNVMRLSLLKSAVYPDPTADQGKHIFTYSLLPHIQSWKEAGTVREAWSLNNPISSRKGSAVKPNFSFLSVSESNMMVDAVKKAENGDGIVVRIHEFEGKRATATMECAVPIKSWQECDLMERPIGQEMENPNIAVHLNPYEIKTYLLHFV